MLTRRAGSVDPRLELERTTVETLEKPVTFEDLVAKVREMLDGPR